MYITISERELKKDKLKIAEITFCYLMAIQNQNPKIWKQLKLLIENVEEENKK